MASTIVPLPNSGPDDEGFGVVWPAPESGLVRLREAKRSMKRTLKAAEGVLSKTKASVKKPKLGKNLAKEAKGNRRGPFGEAYAPVSAPSKGERVKESRQLRESTSADDERGMVQRALEKMFPRPDSPLGSPCSYPESPYIKDIFPSEGFAVFTRNNVPWGVDYKIDEKAAVANLSKPRRVKTEYVDMGKGEGTEESDIKEVAPPGWKGTVTAMQKRHPEIDNPYALTHWMHGQGYTPHAGPRGGHRKD